MGNIHPPSVHYLKEFLIHEKYSWGKRSKLIRNSILRSYSVKINFLYLSHLDDKNIKKDHLVFKHIYFLMISTYHNSKIT